MIAAPRMSAAVARQCAHGHSWLAILESGRSSLADDDIDVGPVATALVLTSLAFLASLASPQLGPVLAAGWLAALLLTGAIWFARLRH
jgi:hypothetical protein